MKLHPMALCAALALLASCASTQHFGAPVSSGEAVQATTLLNHPDMFAGKTVVFEGTVAEVCQSAGCWMIIRAGDKQMRVMTKDHAYFVPKDCAGRRVRAEGVFSMQELSIDEVRHYLEDAGRMEEADKVNAPVQELTLVASGVELLD